MSDPSLAAAPERDVAPVLVLGLGNILLKDDGVGLELLRQLESSRPAAANPVEYVDGGARGVALLGHLCGRHAVLVLDAVSLGQARPGSVVFVDDPLRHPSARGVGAHGANTSGLLASAQLVGELPAHTVVLGVSPAELETGIGLSEPVRAALPAALARAQEVLAELCESVRSEAAARGEASPCTS